MTGKKSYLSEQFLNLLERKHPAGVLIGEAAIEIFGIDTPSNRRKIYRCARALRSMGYSVYAIGRAYYLCGGDPEKLFQVSERKESQVIGNVEGLLTVVEKLVEALEANPDAAKEKLLQKFRRRVKGRIIRLARKLA